MDISNKIPPAQNPAAVKAIQSIQKAASTVKAADRSSSAGDQVDISDRARQLQEARKQLAGLPEVDEQKVADVKAGLAKGTYKVDAERVAANMLVESLLKKI